MAGLVLEGSHGSISFNWPLWASIEFKFRLSTGDYHGNYRILEEAFIFCTTCQCLINGNERRGFVERGFVEFAGYLSGLASALLPDMLHWLALTWPDPAGDRTLAAVCAAAGVSDAPGKPTTEYTVRSAPCTASSMTWMDEPTVR